MTNTCPFKVGDHVRFIAEARESIPELATLTGTVSRIERAKVVYDSPHPPVVYYVYCWWNDGEVGFGYHYQIELVQKMVVDGNELRMENTNAV